MAVRSSSWSKHVHRHTVDHGTHPAGNSCNPYPHHTSTDGQDCLSNRRGFDTEVTTDDSDMESSTSGSHIHRGIRACCHSTSRARHGCQHLLNNAHPLLAEGMHEMNSQAHHHHHYHQHTSSTSHHCNHAAQSHSFEGYPPHLTGHVQQHRHQHHHHHHQQLTQSTHYDGARETSQSCTCSHTCSHTYGTETRAQSGAYRGCRGVLTRGCLCRRAYGPPLPGGLMCVGRGRVGCGYRR